MNLVGGPGPAAYDPAITQSHNRKAAYSMPKDPKFTKAHSKSPGPAEYSGNIEAIKPGRSKHAIGLRTYSRSGEATPGPGKYKTDVSFVDQNKKSQSFTRQIVHNKPQREPTPGPSMYTPKQQKQRAPAYTLRKRTSAYNENGTDEHVGPSSYEVKVHNTFNEDARQSYTGNTVGRTHGARRTKSEDSWGSPGPDHYQTDNISKFDTPEYTFGTSRPSKSIQSSPGPGAYDPTMSKKKISKSMSAQSLHGSVYTTNDNPGPGAYRTTRNTRIESTNPVLSKSASSPAFAIAKEKRFHGAHKSSTPGPGHYQAGSTGIKVKKRGPAFTMAGRWKTKKDVAGGPGPAPYGRAVDATSYQKNLKSRKPAYTMQKGREAYPKGKGKRNETPGPAAYFDRAEQSGTIRRSASAIELSRPRGMAFGLKARSKTPDMTPGPAAYTPYTTAQLGASGNKHTMKGRSPHPDAITTSVYSQTLTRPKKMLSKTTKQRPVAMAY